MKQVVQYGRKDGRTDGEIDMMKLMVSFPNFTKAPNKWNNIYYSVEPGQKNSSFLCALEA
jgi:hypothetical protein